MTDARILFDDLQDQIVAQREVVVEVLKLIHQLSPVPYEERVRERRLLTQSVETGRIGSRSARMSKIHALVRDMLEEGANMHRGPDASGPSAR